MVSIQVVRPRVRPVRQVYPYTFFSDKSHRHSLPDGDRLGSFNQYMDDQDRQQIEFRAPTTRNLTTIRTFKTRTKTSTS